MIVLGLDPGSTGALAWVSKSGVLLEIADMPIALVRGKKRISASLLADLMRRYPGDLHVVVEGVGAMPGQGVSSVFTFGYGAGLIEGVAAGLNLPIELVTSAVWKRRAGVPADKGACRQMAQRLWPERAALFARVKDHNRADAALLARWYALRNQETSRVLDDADETTTEESTVA